MIFMRRRLFMLAAVAVCAIAVVGLSAAATTSARGDFPVSAKRPPAVKTSVKKPAKVAAAPSDLAAVPKSAQSAKDIADYWTADRMRDAQPMEKPLPGGTPASSPTPTETTTRAGHPSKAPAPDPARRKARSPSSGADQFSKSPDRTGNAAEYWTQDMMDSAGPMEKTVPGGDGSGGASGPPGSGVGPGVP